MRGKIRVNNTNPATIRGSIEQKLKRRRQRKITLVEMRRSTHDWFQLIEEAKSKEQAWKFLREQMSNAMPFDNES